MPSPFPGMNPYLEHPAGWMGFHNKYIVEIEAAPGHRFDFSAMFDRVHHPARGREGGDDGAPGSVALDDGTALRPKGWQQVPPGRRLVGSRDHARGLIAISD